MTAVTNAIEIWTPDNPTGVDITSAVEEFVWVESMIKGGFSWSIKFKAKEWGSWNRIIMGRSPIKFRIRSSSTTGESSTRWRWSVVDGARAAFSASDAMLAEVYGADRRLDLLQKDRSRAWKNSTASDVVEAIASEHGLFSDAVTTAGKYDRWQVRESDWEFICRNAIGCATSGGRGDVFLWMDEDIIKLGVVQSQDQSSRRYDVAASDARVVGHVCSYTGRKIDRMGGATLLGVGFDFDTKKGVNVKLDAAAVATHPALALRVPRDQADGLRVLPTTSSGAGSVDSATRGYWGHVAPRYQTVRLESRADLTLTPNAVLETAPKFGEDSESPFDGRYQLLEVVHHYVAGDITTSMVGFRRESSLGDLYATGALTGNTGTKDAYRFGAKNAEPVTRVVEVLD